MQNAGNSKVIKFPVAQPQRRSKNKRMRAITLLVCFFLVIMYFFYALIFQEIELRSLKRQQEQLQTEKQLLIEEQQRLMKEIELLKTDAYIEKVARERLGLIGPKDLLVVPVYLEPATQR
ncbi:MAG: septum formation initiator family protein [bacterium]|nr:septum formation initiator family protein [bacterium]